MDLSELVQSQISADRRRGFAVDFAGDPDRIVQIERDLIGLLGEVGEFANVVKKIRLAATHSGYRGPSLEQAALGLREELADALIYLMRLSFIIGGDLEGDLLAKMKANDIRYGHLER